MDFSRDQEEPVKSTEQAKSLSGERSSEGSHYNAVVH